MQVENQLYKYLSIHHKSIQTIITNLLKESSQIFWQYINRDTKKQMDNQMFCSLLIKLMNEQKIRQILGYGSNYEFLLKGNKIKEQIGKSLIKGDDPKWKIKLLEFVTVWQRQNLIQYILLEQLFCENITLTMEQLQAKMKNKNTLGHFQHQLTKGGIYKNKKEPLLMNILQEFMKILTPINAVELRSYLNNQKKNHISEEKSIFFMGQTRRGKSTIILYLLGYKLQYVQIQQQADTKRVQHVLKETVAPEHIEIVSKNTNNSVTSDIHFVKINSQKRIPNGYSEFGQIYFVDTPGSGDDRGNTRRFYNYFIIERALRSCSLVLPVEVFTLLDLFQKRNQTLKSFASDIIKRYQFQSSKDLQNKILLIFNKCESEQHYHHFKNQVKNYLRQENSNLTKQQKLVYEFILKQANNKQIFLMSSFTHTQQKRIALFNKIKAKSFFPKDEVLKQTVGGQDLKRSFQDAEKYYKEQIDLYLKVFDFQAVAYYLQLLEILNDKRINQPKVFANYDILKKMNQLIKQTFVDLLERFNYIVQTNRQGIYSKAQYGELKKIKMLVKQKYLFHNSIIYLKKFNQNNFNSEIIINSYLERMKSSLTKQLHENYKMFCELFQVQVGMTIQNIIHENRIKLQQMKGRIMVIIKSDKNYKQIDVLYQSMIEMGNKVKNDQLIQSLNTQSDIKIHLKQVEQEVFNRVITYYQQMLQKTTQIQKYIDHYSQIENGFSKSPIICQINLNQLYQNIKKHKQSKLIDNLIQKLKKQNKCHDLDYFFQKINQKLSQWALKVHEFVQTQTNYDKSIIRNIALYLRGFHEQIQLKKYYDRHIRQDLVRKIQQKMKQIKGFKKIYFENLIEFIIQKDVEYKSLEKQLVLKKNQQDYYLFFIESIMNDPSLKHKESSLYKDIITQFQQNKQKIIGQIDSNFSQFSEFNKIISNSDKIISILNKYFKIKIIKQSYQQDPELLKISNNIQLLCTIQDKISSLMGEITNIFKFKPNLYQFQQFNKLFTSNMHKVTKIVEFYSKLNAVFTRKMIGKGTLVQKIEKIKQQFNKQIKAIGALLQSKITNFNKNSYSSNELNPNQIYKCLNLYNYLLNKFNQNKYQIQQLKILQSNFLDKCQKDLYQIESNNNDYENLKHLRKYDFLIDLNESHSNVKQLYLKIKDEIKNNQVSMLQYHHFEYVTFNKNFLKCLHDKYQQQYSKYGQVHHALIRQDLKQNFSKIQINIKQINHQQTITTFFKKSCEFLQFIKNNDKYNFIKNIPEFIRLLDTICEQILYKLSCTIQQCKIKIKNFEISFVDGEFKNYQNLIPMLKYFKINFNEGLTNESTQLFEDYKQLSIQKNQQLLKINQLKTKFHVGQYKQESYHLKELLRLYDIYSKEPHIEASIYQKITAKVKMMANQMENRMKKQYKYKQYLQDYKYLSTIHLIIPNKTNNIKLQPSQEVKELNSSLKDWLISSIKTELQGINSNYNKVIQLCYYARQYRCFAIDKDINNKIQQVKLIIEKQIKQSQSTLQRMAILKQNFWLKQEHRLNQSDQKNNFLKTLCSCQEKIYLEMTKKYIIGVEIAKIQKIQQKVTCEDASLQLIQQYISKLFDHSSLFYDQKNLYSVLQQFIVLFQSFLKDYTKRQATILNLQLYYQTKENNFRQEIILADIYNSICKLIEKYNITININYSKVNRLQQFKKNYFQNLEQLKEKNILNDKKIDKFNKVLDMVQYIDQIECFHDLIDLANILGDYHGYPHSKNELDDIFHRKYTVLVKQILQFLQNSLSQVNIIKIAKMINVGFILYKKIHMMQKISEQDDQNNQQILTIQEQIDNMINRIEFINIIQNIREQEIIKIFMALVKIILISPTNRFKHERHLQICLQSLKKTNKNSYTTVIQHFNASQTQQNINKAIIYRYLRKKICKFQLIVNPYEFHDYSIYLNKINSLQSRNNRKLQNQSLQSLCSIYSCLTDYILQKQNEVFNILKGKLRQQQLKEENCRWLIQISFKQRSMLIAILIAHYSRVNSTQKHIILVIYSNNYKMNVQREQHQKFFQSINLNTKQKKIIYTTYIDMMKYLNSQQYKDKTFLFILQQINDIFTEEVLNHDFQFKIQLKESYHKKMRNFYQKVYNVCNKQAISRQKIELLIKSSKQYDQLQSFKSVIDLQLAEMIESAQNLQYSYEIHGKQLYYRYRGRLYKQKDRRMYKYYQIFTKIKQKNRYRLHSQQNYQLQYSELPFFNSNIHDILQSKCKIIAFTSFRNQQTKQFINDNFDLKYIPIQKIDNILQKDKGHQIIFESQTIISSYFSSKSNIILLFQNVYAIQHFKYVYRQIIQHLEAVTETIDEELDRKVIQLKLKALFSTKKIVFMTKHVLFSMSYQSMASFIIQNQKIKVNLCFSPQTELQFQKIKSICANFFIGNEFKIVLSVKQAQKHNLKFNSSSTIESKQLIQKLNHNQKIIINLINQNKQNKIIKDDVFNLMKQTNKQKFQYFINKHDHNNQMIDQNIQNEPQKKLILIVDGAFINICWINILQQTIKKLYSNRRRILTKILIIKNYEFGSQIIQQSPYSSSAQILIKFIKANIYDSYNGNQAFSQLIKYLTHKLKYEDHPKSLFFIGNHDNISSRQKAKKQLYNISYWLRNSYDYVMISKDQLYELSKELQQMKDIDFNNIYMARRQGNLQIKKYKQQNFDFTSRIGTVNLINKNRIGQNSVKQDQINKNIHRVSKQIYQFVMQSLNN